MSNSKPGKHGVPVLAYLTSEPLSLSCLMRIQHHEPRKQVTFMLRTCVSLHGADDEQAFVAQYDADNLLPDTAANAVTVHVPKTRLDEIVRNPKSTQITTLSLQLKHPCSLWCPRTDALLPKSEPSYVESFNELVQLAKATTVHIVFDYHWLSLDNRVPFQRIVKGKETMTGFPVADYYSRFFRRADWTIFGPAAPGAEPSKKRPREVSSSASSPPPYKRKVVDGEQPISSPTELATSPAADKRTDEDEDDFQTHAITRVVRWHLPTVLAEVLPATLKQVLPDLLPLILPTLFAIPASFSSSFDSESSQPPTLSDKKAPSSILGLTFRPHDLTPLGASLLPHILAHLTPQISKLHNASIKKWTDAAALELEESAQDKMVELTQARDDGVSELQRQAGWVLDEVRARGWDVSEELSENVGEEVERSAWESGMQAVRHVRREIDAARRSLDKRFVPGLRGRRTGKGGYRGLANRWKTAGCEFHRY